MGYVEEEALRDLNKCLIGTMASVSSILLHCENPTTLKRITGAWGSLIFLGENASHTIDYEKVSILISTQQKERINEVIEVKARREVFLVQVYELGLNLHSTQTANPIHPQAAKKVVASPESSSNSSSGSIQSTTSSSGIHFKCIGEDEVANTICLGSQ
ncbi:hypothetical protein V6N13_025308 [Hibiscus sabdariffa]